MHYLRGVKFPICRAACTRTVAQLSHLGSLCTGWVIHTKQAWVSIQVTDIFSRMFSLTFWLLSTVHRIWGATVGNRHSELLWNRVSCWANRHVGQQLFPKGSSLRPKIFLTHTLDLWVINSASFEPTIGHFPHSWSVLRPRILHRMQCNDWEFARYFTSIASWWSNAANCWSACMAWVCSCRIFGWIGFNGEYGRGAVGFVDDEELRGCTAVGGLSDVWRRPPWFGITKLINMLPSGSQVMVWIWLTGYLLNQGIPSIASHWLTSPLTHIT